MNSFGKWKVGLAISVAGSALVAGAGLTAGMNWRAFLAVFCTACLTHCGAFLKKHPVEEIQDQKTDATPRA